MRRPRLDPEDGAVLGYPHSTEFQFRKAGDEAPGEGQRDGEEREREGRGDGGRGSPAEQFLSGASQDEIDL